MIGGLSPWHILIVVIALAVLFGGRGKLSSIMGDAAKGVRAFKDGLKGEEEGPSTAAAAPAAVAHDALAEAKAREQSLREELARQTAAREAAEARAARESV